MNPLANISISRPSLSNVSEIRETVTGIAAAATAPVRRLISEEALPLEGRRVVITGGSSGIGAAAALAVAQAGGTPILVARSLDKLEEVKAGIEAAGGTAFVYTCDVTDAESVTELVATLVKDHESIDMLVNNAGRSIRRSLSLSHDRFHDFERTMALNYFGAVRLIMELLPHMKEHGFGHIVNISSIGVQTNTPRFAAYVASKSALDAFSRVAASEVHGDGITFTTVHMPLVRTPMIAPTSMYDAFPVLSPEEAADMVVRALIKRPKEIGTPIGTLGELSYTLAPGLVDVILHRAYRLFPDSLAAKGVTPDSGETVKKETAMSTRVLAKATVAVQDQPLSRAAKRMVRVLPGIHW
ncbi:SDR family NAD(P)-dependent oxidoreductase [Antrihabitans sp. YC2-6]|uniref:SDR family NAD(P)-dependent oxidoreductase n=1 Tax=Antrihabitans sp. YC2-6 TaxID=2799498 RepID=UPI0018F7868B|nr:SDR family NAD(P)-dependent oxidoreductase [Antrihabitans sp. YC2-6]MBJ8345239.1 SDR family NAD(P)-dependent oxidoreductase [Antrihabitans sp. YC2-6]